MFRGRLHLLNVKKKFLTRWKMYWSDIYKILSHPLTLNCKIKGFQRQCDRLREAAKKSFLVDSLQRGGGGIWGCLIGIFYFFFLPVILSTKPGGG